MASGVKCNDACITAYEELKLRKNCRFIFYKILEDKEIVVDKTGDRSATFEDFRDAIKECGNNARYAIYDFEPQPNKPNLLFVSWIPDNATVRTRMLYASSTDALKLKLPGFKAAVQLTDFDDVTPEYFTDNLPRGS